MSTFWYDEDFEDDLLANVRSEIVDILTDHGVTLTDQSVVIAPVNENAIPATGTFAQIGFTSDEVERTDWTQLVGDGENALRRRWGYRSCQIALEVYRSDCKSWMAWITQDLVSPFPENLVRRENRGFLSIKALAASNIDAFSPSGTLIEQRRKAAIAVTFGVLVEVAEESLQTVTATTAVAGIQITVEASL